MGKEKKEKIYMRFFVGVFLVVYSVSFSQSVDSTIYVLPSFDSLTVCLQSVYKERAYIEVSEYMYIEKYKWLKYCPSFGWNFISNTPYVGYSTSQLFDVLNYKRKKVAFLNTILHRVNAEYNSSYIELRAKYDIFSTKTDILKQKLEVLELEKAYIEIEENQYHKKDLSPSQWIKTQITYKNKLIELTNLVAELQQLKESIFVLTGFSSPAILIKSLEDVSANRH